LQSITQLPFHALRPELRDTESQPVFIQHTVGEIVEKFLFDKRGEFVGSDGLQRPPDRLIAEPHPVFRITLEVTQFDPAPVREIALTELAHPVQREHGPVLLAPAIVELEEGLAIADLNRPGAGQRIAVVAIHVAKEEIGKPVTGHQIGAPHEVGTVVKLVKEKQVVAGTGICCPRRGNGRRGGDQGEDEPD